MEWAGVMQVLSSAQREKLKLICLVDAEVLL